jgi:hypothetical protein
LTTGTGASGDIRETVPHRKWSTMISPMTSTRALLSQGTSCCKASMDLFTDYFICGN